MRLHIDKTNNYFLSKNEFIFKKIMYSDMSSESIQSVAYDYDDFQHVNFIFSQIFISLF